MAKVKASDVAIVKKLVRTQGGDLEARVRARLSPDALSVYSSSLSTEWIELGRESEVLSIAAPLLFPDERKPLHRLGHEVARIQYSGIYKVFLLIPTVGFIVKQVSKAWRTLYDQGDVRVEALTEHSGTLVALGLPDLTAAQREYIGGYLSGILGLTGAKNIQVTRRDSDPKAWRWTLTWG
jgi:uncharacterized protein (TIGR02265 family)